MKAPKSKTTKIVSPRMAILTIIVLFAVLGSSILLIVKSTTGGWTTETKGTSSTLLKKNTLAQSKEHNALQAGDVDYNIIVKRNLFLNPAMKIVALPTKKVAFPPMIQVSPFNITEIKSEVVELPEQIAFTGMVELPTGKFALLENIETKEAQYVQVGSSAFGCTVLDASSSMATISKNGEKSTLLLGANKVEEAIVPPKVQTPVTANQGFGGRNNRFGNFPQGNSPQANGTAVTVPPTTGIQNSPFAFPVRRGTPTTPGT